MAANRLLYQQFSFEAAPGRVPVMDENGAPKMQEIIVLNVMPMEMTPNGPMPLGTPIELWFQPDTWDKLYQDGKGSKLQIVRDAPGINGAA